MSTSLPVVEGTGVAGADERPSFVLARFVAGLTPSEVPATVKDTALRAIAAVIAAASRGTGAALAEAVAASIGELGSPPQATAAGAIARVGASYAAMINGTAACLGGLELDRGIEASAVVVPVVTAAFAASELIGAAPDELLAGVVAGLECALRTVSSLGEQHVARGWDIAGTAGCVGAAMAAARVAALSPEEVHDALGFAATQAAGVRSGGSPVAALVAGKAASDGLESALLARAGLIGPPEPLEGRRGLLALVTTSALPARLVDGLGSTWLITALPTIGSGGRDGTFEPLSRKLSDGAPIDELAEFLRVPVQ